MLFFVLMSRTCDFYPSLDLEPGKFASCCECLRFFPVSPPSFYRTKARWFTNQLIDVTLWSKCENVFSVSEMNLLWPVCSLPFRLTKAAELASNKISYLNKKKNKKKIVVSWCFQYKTRYFLQHSFFTTWILRIHIYSVIQNK